MKAKLSLTLVALAVVLALGLTACSRGRDDAQISTEVQQKIFSDPAIQSRQITVQSANGVVTLSGQVASDNERMEAANQAAQVPGVKTVVNNLTVAPAEAAAPPAPEPAAAAQPASPAPRRRYEEPRPERRTSRPNSEVVTRTYGDTPESAPTPSTAAAQPAALTPPADTPSTPPPPRKVTIPAGTPFSVRLVDPIDSATNHPGDVFRATLDSPITIDGEVVIPANADVSGRVVQAQSAGHYAGRSEIALELTSLKVNSHSYTLQTDQYTQQAASRGSQTAKRVGTGAAIGAIIGAIAGGGKGAAIGGAVGAGAGGGVQTATKAQQIKLAPEALLSFRLQSPLTVYAASAVDSNRTRLPD